MGEDDNFPRVIFLLCALLLFSELQNAVAPSSAPSVTRVIVDDGDDTVEIISAVVLGLVAFLQLVLLWKQNQLAQAQFTASHRPRLILRRVTFERTDDPVVPPGVEISIANVGDTAALITKLVIVFEIASYDPPVAWKILRAIRSGTSPGLESRFEGRQVPGGDSIVLSVPPDSTATPFGFNRAAPGTIGVFCVGYIDYTDDEGKHRRRTGFIRRGNFETRYFERVDSPDFEYAD